jgi:ketosteroid isomerase-like protein
MDAIAETSMNTISDNETLIRQAYKIADAKDVDGWAGCFDEDGTFTNESIGVTYRGRKEVGIPVRIFATAFPDMHRDLQNVYVTGDMVIVELTLNGTQTGPLEIPNALIRPSGRRMKAPCCDVFRLKNGKIQSFNCYPLITDSAWV